MKTQAKTQANVPVTAEKDFLFLYKVPNYESRIT